MRRVLLVTACLLACVMPARAASDAARAWKKAHKAIEKREDAYWEDFQGRLTGIYQEWTAQQRFWRSDPDGYKDERVSLDGLRALYAEYAALQADAAEADLALARAEAPDATEELFDALLDLAKEIDEVEKELAEARPTGRGSRYEQEPSVRRHGQVVRLDGLETALAARPDATAFLAGEGFETATKDDKDRSTVRTAAVLDALGRVDDPEATTALVARVYDARPFARIAALENVLARGPLPDDALAMLLGDPAPQVRRALLRALARSDAFAALPRLVARLPATRGLEREFLIRALEALSGAPRGDDAGAWQGWLEANAKALADGTFQRPEPAKAEGEGDATEAPKEEPKAEPKEDATQDAKEEAEDAPPAPLAVAPALVFYGLPSPSARVVFVLDGSSNLLLPADYELQSKRSNHHWLTTGPKWRETAIDHKGLLLQQVEQTLEAAPEDARFRVIHLFGSTPGRVGVYGDRRPLAPTRAGIKSLLKKLEKPNPAGQLSLEEGLRLAVDLAGLDPFEDPEDPDETAEVIQVVDTGWQGGRWPLPELVVAAFARENRWRALAVNAIRIADEKDEAAAMLRGLAEVSGGRYLWLTKLP